MCDRFLSLFLAWYDTRSQEVVCQWFNCHSKTWQALLQKITDIIFRQGEWRSLFSSATPHPLFFVTLIIIHILMRINMNCATNLSVTWVVAQQLDCDIIKVWREWLSFHGHKNIFVFLTQTIERIGNPLFFCASWETVYKWLCNTAGASILGMYRKETLWPQRNL